jgi:DNA-3-methyladenine glycosylase
VRSAPEHDLNDPKAQLTAARIVETEAYHGTDPASHCARGETPRCAIMFGDPGVAYVYFIYGMYEMLNFVTEKKGYPGAVLIRAVEPLLGHELMKKRRANGRRTRLSERDWTNGPGRLCQALGIELSHNGQALNGPELFVVDDGFVPAEISITPRVGITKGLDEHWRYFIQDNSFVSKSPLNRQARSYPFSSASVGNRRRSA